jgi:cbb3-type cytochrome oxidase maturation protein
MVLLYVRRYICNIKQITMSVIILLLGASLSVGLTFLAAFIWSVKSGQFEDDYSPAHRILFDDAPADNNYPDTTLKQS